MKLKCRYASGQYFIGRSAESSSARDPFPRSRHTTSASAFSSCMYADMKRCFTLRLRQTSLNSPAKYSWALSDWSSMVSVEKPIRSISFKHSDQRNAI